MRKKAIAKVSEALDLVRASDLKKKAELIGMLEQIEAELVRKEQSEDVLRPLREGLESAAQEFEASHPKLAPVVNEICALLASVGI